MNKAKLFILPALLGFSALCATQKGLLTVSVENKHLTSNVEYSTEVQELINEEGSLKAIFQQAGDQFLVELYANENGEWVQIQSIELPAEQGENLSKGSAIPSVDGIVTLQTISE